MSSRKAVWGRVTRRGAEILVSALLLLSPTLLARAEDTSVNTVEACGACHGPRGLSEIEGIPSLAGQPDRFIQWQLVYFRAGTRKNEVMSPLAEKLSDTDIRRLGGELAHLAPAAKPASDPAPELTKTGAGIVHEQHCASCHRDDFAGDQATPRVAYQREDYLLKALRDFKSGNRSGGAMAAMAEVVYPLGDKELVALAHYLAYLP